MLCTVMGVDLGTQGIKVIIYAADNKSVVASVSAPLNMIAREDGSREQLAQWWLDGFHACLRQFSSELKASVVAIGVSGLNMPLLVPRDLVVAKRRGQDINVAVSVDIGGVDRVGCTRGDDTLLPETSFAISVFIPENAFP